jgi:hypothetical protein
MVHSNTRLPAKNSSWSFLLYMATHVDLRRGNAPRLG